MLRIRQRCWAGQPLCCAWVSRSSLWARVTRSWQLQPTHAEALRLKSATLMSLRRYDEAREILDQQLQILPESAPLWLVKAKLLMLQGKWGDADRALDEALSRDPELCDAWISKGNVLLHLGNSADALSAFDRALALEPENDEARSGRELCAQWVAHRVYHWTAPRPAGGAYSTACQVIRRSFGDACCPPRRILIQCGGKRGLSMVVFPTVSMARRRSQARIILGGSEGVELCRRVDQVGRAHRARRRHHGRRVGRTARVARPRPVRSPHTTRQASGCLTSLAAHHG